jgi:sarcosine oxidase subunit gamma
MVESLRLESDTDFALCGAPPLRRHVLRGGADVVAKAGAALGLAIPVRPMTSADAGDVAALWLGPDEWLLLNAPDDLAESLNGLPHSLVDVSHRQTGLVLRGTLAARVLNSGCPLDLSLRAFPVGMVTRTIFHKAEIVLWRRSDGFHVEVWRSFAAYVTDHLIVARRAATGGPADWS